MVKNPPFNAGDVGLIPDWETEIPHTEGQLNWYAATTELVHPMDREAWHAPVHGGRTTERLR